MYFILSNGFWREPKVIEKFLSFLGLPQNALLLWSGGLYDFQAMVVPKGVVGGSLGAGRLQEVGGHLTDQRQGAIDLAP